MTKITRTHSVGCSGKGNSMNTRMKALLATAALMLTAWHSAAHAEMSLYYIHNDHLGTPQVVTNEDQNVVWQADYQPFGEVDVTVNTLDQEARFPGQYTDDATGLHYNYFRDYDPSIGRYIQSDPIGLNGGINTYGYVGGNPTGAVDPLGLYTLADARGSLYERGILPDSPRFPMPAPYSDTQVFDEWLRLENENTDWLAELPSCPQTVDMCTSDQWLKPNTNVSQKYHPGGAFEIRSRTTPGNHSNQCIYDSNRQLMTDIPAAGTADFRPCPIVGLCLPHYLHDVRPFELADKLNRISDYYNVRPSL